MTTLLLGALAACAAEVIAPEVPPPPMPAAIELRWHAPPECPTAEEIHARIQALLSGPPAGSGTMVVEAAVDGSGGAFTLDLVTTFGEDVHHRHIESPSCEGVADATTTLLALALEPGLELLPTDLPPPPAPLEQASAIESRPARTEPLRAPEPASEPAPAPEPAPALRRTRTASPLLRVAAGAERGAQPGIGAALELAGGLAWPRVRVEASGVWLPGRRAGGPGAATAWVQLGGVAAHVCARPRVRGLELPACGGVEGGVMRASPRDLPGGRTRFGPWLGPSLRAGVARRWSRVGVWAAVTGVWGAWRTRLHVGGETVFLPDPVSLRAAVGLELWWS